MLHNQLVHVGAGKRTLARKQFLIDDCKAILIAMTADQPVKGFRGGVHRRDPSRHRGGRALQVLYQSEVGHFNVVVNQKNVLRLNVQVLQTVLIIHQIEGFSTFLHDAEKLGPGDARQTLSPTFFEAVPKIAIRQLHDNQELAVDNVITFQGEDVRMTDSLDAAEGLQLLFGPLAVRAGGLQVPVDKLNSLE